MKQIAIFLYSKSKIIAQPWADAGIECHLFDLDSVTRTDGNLHYWGGDLRKRIKQIGELKVLHLLFSRRIIKRYPLPVYQRSKRKWF